MGLTGTLILLVIIIVGGLFFWSELTAFASDVSGFIKTADRDSQVKIPRPTSGTTVCDLFITIDVRSRSAISGTLVSTERILFTDGQEGKEIGWQWSNCRPFGLSLFSLTTLDLLGDSPRLEFFIPAEDIFDQQIILSYIIIDEDGLEKKLPLYQDITYIHPAFVADFDFQQKLKFRDLVPKDYVLEIFPTEAHWDNKKVGQPLKKVITFD